MAGRVILDINNADVNDLNFKIQELLPDELVSYKSIDLVCNANSTVNYTTEFLYSLDLPGWICHATAPFTTKSWISDNRRPIILLWNFNSHDSAMALNRLLKN